MSAEHLGGHRGPGMAMIELRLSGMECSIRTAMAQQHEELDAMIGRSMKGAIENIQRQLDSMVQAALGRVMNEAVQRASEMAAEGLADELASAMAKQVREQVSASMKKVKR